MGMYVCTPIAACMASSCLATGAQQGLNAADLEAITFLAIPMQHLERREEEKVFLRTDQSRSLMISIAF